ncbi:hypothetical protein [Streptomyces sp. NPDC093093]
MCSSAATAPDLAVTDRDCTDPEARMEDSNSDTHDDGRHRPGTISRG